MSAEEVLQRARQRGVLIATAESCTGGLISAALTDIPGSSDVFERGFVTYSNQAKIELLGVDPEHIATHGAVSAEVADAMARGAVARSQAQLAVAVTGVAGPGGTATKPEGLVCFGLADATTDSLSVHVETQKFGPIGRQAVRKTSVEYALRLLLTALR